MFDLSMIQLSLCDIKKGITFPQSLTLELAEFIGIIIGDGHLSVLFRLDKKGNRFTQSDLFIAGNCDENEYLDYIKGLFYYLLGLIPRCL